MAFRLRQQHFQVSKGGHIFWVAHPDKCFDVAHGSEDNGNHIILWDCTKENTNQHFVVPSGAVAVGPIRWAAHPSKCLGVSQTSRIMLEDCREDMVNQGFIFPALADAEVESSLSEAADDLLKAYELVVDNGTLVQEDPRIRFV